MRRPSVLLGLAVLGVLVCAAPALATLSRAEKSLLAVMNEARAAHNLQPLRIDPALSRAARYHSRDMLSRRYFKHGQLARRMHRFGIRGRVVAENIAWWRDRYSVARVIVRMWLRSPHHRANLLGPAFRRVGIGAVPGRYGGAKVRMVTVDFAG